MQPASPSGFRPPYVPRVYVPPRASGALQLVLLGIAALALLLPVLALKFGPPPPPPAAIRVVTAPKRVVPKAEVPQVEPVKVIEVTPEDARAINAAVPFSTLPNPAARPFLITGSPEDRARAVDCLAAGMLYEAGDDATGERAVGQVILNRLRHPAFPKTICGVVFQGSERSTGCQFTFTCDGAMARIPSPAAWERARVLARMAVAGSVYKPVGFSTHYHTDWVVPYWSSSLDKVVAVDTHLFFRWTGWWGTPPAFNRAYAGAEPVIPKLAGLSPEHRTNAIEAALAMGALDAGTIADASLPKPLAADDNSFIVTLDKRMAPDAFAALAVRTCGERPFCKFMGWTEKSKTPAALPLAAPAIESMSFSYFRDQKAGFAKALWNCAQYQRPSPLQCMRQSTIARPSGLAVSTDKLKVPGVITGAEAVPTLGGVRRKSDVKPEGAAPAAAATPVAKAPAAAPSPTPSKTAVPVGR